MRYKQALTRRILDASQVYYIAGTNPYTKSVSYLCRYYGGRRWFGRLGYENEEFQTYKEAEQVFKQLVKRVPKYADHLTDLKIVEKNWNVQAVLEVEMEEV